MNILLAVLFISLIITAGSFDLIGCIDLASTIYKGRSNYDKANALHSMAWRWSHRIYHKAVADFITGEEDCLEI